MVQQRGWIKPTIHLFACMDTSLPACQPASRQRIQIQASQADEWSKTGTQAQMHQQMQMQVQQGGPQVWKPDSQTTAEAGAGNQEQVA